MKKFNTNKGYISMNKTAFAFIAITIILLTSFIPVAENASAKEAEETKTIEVPVKIYTPYGVKEIRKELPVNEARKLMHMADKTKDAIATLLSKNAPFIEKVKANAIIDSFLYELKKNGLLGDISIKEARELITGKYLQKQRNSIEMQKINVIARFLQQRWEVNVMCYFMAFGSIMDIFPWNFFLWWLSLHNPTIISGIAFFLIVLFDLIPHTTTIGYWNIKRMGVGTEAHVYTFGLLGERSITTEGGESVGINAITLGFTGIVISFFINIAIGFCSFVTMKEITIN